MYKTTIVAILAGFASQALAVDDATMQYVLELQAGQDAAYRTAWKNANPVDDVLFTGGSATGGVTYSGIITWDAKVLVSGSHGGSPTQGAANVVFSLELRDNNGNLVSAGSGAYDFGKATQDASGTAPPGAGVQVTPVVGGFFSQINDNTVNASSASKDGNEAAAFTVAFTNPGTNPTDIFTPFKPFGQGVGRLIDVGTGWGPGFDYFQYPSAGANSIHTTGFPAGASPAIASGVLAGMGAGYSKFLSSGGGQISDGNGDSTNAYSWGVGILDATCGLGQPPIAEGQLNLSGLPAGTYTLTLKPGTGNNVLKTDIGCAPADASQGDKGDFAIACDVQPANVSVAFIVGGGAPPPCVRSIAARNLIYKNSCYDSTSGTTACNGVLCSAVMGHACTIDDAMAPNAGIGQKAPQLKGTSSATIDNYSTYLKGLNCFSIDVTHGASCAALVPTNAMFVFTRGAGNVAQPATALSTAPVISIATLNATTDRVYFTLPDLGTAGAIPNHNWLKVVVKGAVGVDPANALPGLAADDVFYWGLAVGDDGLANSPANQAIVSSTDVLDARGNHTGFTDAHIKNNVNKSKWDWNKDSTVTSTDELIAQGNPSPFTPLNLSLSRP